MMFKKGLLFFTFSVSSFSLFAPTNDETCGSACVNYACGEEKADFLSENIIRAIEMGDIESLRTLVGENRENLEREIYQNMTPLIVALAYLSRGLDTREVIKFLIDSGADTTRMVFSEGEKTYNVIETLYNIRENVRRNQDYLAQVESWVEDVISML